MDDSLIVSPLNALRLQALQELQKCNDVTIRYRLYLSPDQMHNIANRQMEALADTGRIELGDGLLSMLILAFCDSPYIDQNNYEQTLSQLLETFYVLKNESMDLVTDGELIVFMKGHFDGVCEGSLESLIDVTLEELCRRARFGEWDETDE